MAHTPTDAEQREHLWSLIKDIRYAMLTTRHPDGFLHSRPMTTQNAADGEGDSLWFFLSRSGEPLHDLQAIDQVNLSYAEPAKDTYVSVSGVAELVEDVQQKHRLWSKMNEAYFPNGPDDPDVALVRVRIQQADFWDVKESKMVQLFKMAGAAVTGHAPPQLGERGQVRMH
jgi:general stress protein 26